jgi:hypothetical protein
MFPGGLDAHTRSRTGITLSHRQLTDLLALSVSNLGRLATFDGTISLKAVKGAAAQNLDLIAA